MQCFMHWRGLTRRQPALGSTVTPRDRLSAALDELQRGGYIDGHRLTKKGRHLLAGLPNPSMFNRFTSRAFQVLFHARSEASQFGSSAVEPEHILLGVLDEGKGLASRIVARTGGAPEDFRSDVVRHLTTARKCRSRRNAVQHFLRTRAAVCSRRSRPAHARLHRPRTSVARPAARGAQRRGRSAEARGLEIRSGP